jgi:hypothetical protein
MIDGMPTDPSRCERDTHMGMAAPPEGTHQNRPRSAPAMEAPLTCESRRLRAMRRFALAALLALSCISAAGSAPAQGGSLRQLRFSPDGRYALAQDSSAITVLTVSPLAVLFRIPAQLAGDAQFTPDSREVVFVSSPTRLDRQPPAERKESLIIRSPPHVERWRIADQIHVDSPEIRGAGCGTQALSPDGRISACEDLQGTLRLTDVASGDTFFEKKQFVKLVPSYNILPGGLVDLPNGQFWGDLGEACIDYSPDAQFLLAAPCGGAGKKLAYDLREKSVVRLPPFKGHDGLSAFLSPHRLIVSSYGWEPRQGVVSARVVAFPSGKLLSRPRIPAGHLYRADDPGFVLIRPFGKRANPHDPNARRAAAADLSTGEVIVSETPALDVFGRYYIAEPSAGTVGLYERAKGLQATVALHEK